jgi:hypothetical protein
MVCGMSAPSGGPLLIQKLLVEIAQEGSTAQHEAQANLGIVPTKSTGLAWNSGAIVANGTVTINLSTPYATVITSVNAEIAAGSFVGAVVCNGTTVGGLGAVTVNGTNTVTTATSPNTFAAGSVLSLVVSSATSSPANGVFQINYTAS